MRVPGARNGLRWETTAEIAARYGADKLAYVEIINVDELRPASQLVALIRAAAPNATFTRYRGGRAILAPVSDFDSFCRRLDFGQVIERDNAAKFARFKGDPGKYLTKAKVVRIELVNAQDMVRRAIGAPRADDARQNLELLMALAVEPRNERQAIEFVGDRIDVAPVDDFEKFSAKLDFAEIVSKDAADRTLKLRIKPEQLTGEAVAKRVAGNKQLKSWELRRLGLESDRPAPFNQAGNTSEAPKGPSAAPKEAAGGLQAEYARLAQLLNTGDVFGKREALNALELVRPADVEDKATRQLIARGYRSVALEGYSSDQARAMRGLVVWGGKYSVPVLIEVMEKSRTSAPAEAFDALAELKDPRGAEITARYLGSSFNHDDAVRALRKMGSVAETALIAAAPSDDADVSLAAVQLLGDVGDKQSLVLLQRASRARNLEVRQAAKDSVARIRARQKAGKSVDESLALADEPNSPFAASNRGRADLRALRAAASPGGAGRDEITDDQKGDWSQVRVLTPEKASGGFITADPAAEAGAATFQPVSLGKGIAGEQPAAFDVGGIESLTAVVIHRDQQNPSFARLELVNLSQSKPVASTRIIGGTEQQCYLSPSGSRVLIVSKSEGFSRHVRLNVIDARDGKLVDHDMWYPYPDTTGWANDIKWADWLDEERFLTLNGSNSLVLWQVDGRRAVYQIDTTGGRTVAGLSPGRKYLALAGWRGLELFNAENGQLLALLSSGVSHAAALGFSPDGKKVATVPDSDGASTVFDITTSKQVGGAYGAGATSLDWLDNEFFLAGGREVLKAGLLRPVWRYESPTVMARQHGPWRWFLSNAALIPIKLPHDAVYAAAREADPDAVYFFLKPDMKVSLDVQLSQEAAEIRQAIAGSLQKQGFVIEENQPIRVIASDTTGESKQQTYRFFGRMPDQTVSFTERTIRASLEVDGAPLWGWINHRTAPSSIQLKEGESAQAIVDKVFTEPWINHFKDFKLPAKAFDERKATPLGTSQLTATGIE
jgi:hypothetical protein